MNRWTIEELNNTDDISFAICILNERKNKLNMLCPLYRKLCESINALTNERK